MTLKEIRAWVEFESQKPNISSLYAKVCDELQLIAAWESQLHNHTIDEQLDFVLKVSYWESLPEPVKKASTLIGDVTKMKPYDFVWARLPEKDRADYKKMFIQLIKEEQTKNPEVRVMLDWENNRAYCEVDMEILRHIDNSVQYINNLFEKEKPSIIFES